MDGLEVVGLKERFESCGLFSESLFFLSLLCFYRKN